MTIVVERLTEFQGSDLYDLCDATEAAVIEGGGFGWLRPPPRPALEAFYRGVLVVPERSLFVGRLDGVVCAAAQLQRMPPNNEAQAFQGQLAHSFVAPWARGHGLARAVTVAVEKRAREEGFKVLRLDVRETLTAAIKLYESLGYVHWGTNPKYALIDGTMIAGRYYYKDLKQHGQ
ncbi:MAG: GNAT family N-acetyltransferase [Proteobacteria bacterium]|nr:GNAT family N-acetyltransferase [Pseudomonadota bacterium]